LNLLIDTHPFLWWLAQDPQLPRKARQHIVEAESVFVSAATIWEASIKMAKGNLDVKGDLIFEIQRNNFQPLPVTVHHALAAGALPRHHNDPFDRMLVAQAIAESLTLLTHDLRLKAYDAHVILV